MDHREIISKMTLEEKITFCTGKDLWNTKTIPACVSKSIAMNDGPHGLRKETFDENGKKTGTVKATAFAASSLLASSWNRELAKRVGEAAGKETRAHQVNILLGPGVNIKRNPLCGRNMEYFSEDPVLAGELAAAWISGLQSTGVGASLKHFCCNNKEKLRRNYNVTVDDRTLREIYLKPFEICVKKAQPETVMSSYNKTNGMYSGQNPYLVDTILRKEWGFRGLVLSDWWAIWDRMEGFEAGLDLEMPYNSKPFTKSVIKAVKEGRLSEEKIDICCDRLLTLIDRLYTEERFTLDTEESAAVALEEAEEGAVLLKNDGILPLKKGERILLVGRSVEEHIFGGGGSSDVNPSKLVSLKDGLDMLGVSYRYLAGTDENGLTDEKGLSAAKDYDKVILCLADLRGVESEDYDRKNMKMDEASLALVEKVLALSRDVAVVTMFGAPVEMPFAERVRAILHMGFSGQMGGLACAKILTGAVNPSGKLAETYPYRYEDCDNANGFLTSNLAMDYREAGFVGYRYYATANVPVRFPFGFGLSYTTFEYTDLNVKKKENALEAVFTVKNTGKVGGSEVCEVYIGKPNVHVPNPVIQLAGFEKIRLEAGESRTVSVEIPMDELKFRDVRVNGDVLETGVYHVYAGGSSDALSLKADAAIEGVEVERQPVSEWYFKPHGEPTADDFASLLALEGRAPQKS